MVVAVLSAPVHDTVYGVTCRAGPPPRSRPTAHTWLPCVAPPSWLCPRRRARWATLRHPARSAPRRRRWKRRPRTRSGAVMHDRLSDARAASWDGGVE